MKGESSSQGENPLQKISFTSGGSSSHVSGSASENDPNMQQLVAANEKIGSQKWTLPNPFHNYVEYLTESSTYLPKTEENMIGSNYATFGSISDVNGTDRNLFYNDPGKACGFKTNNDHSSAEVNIGKQVDFWRSDGFEKVKEAMEFESTQHHHPLYAENPASWTSKSIGCKRNVSPVDSTVMTDAPCFRPKRGSSSTRQKNTDRQRRQRMADSLKALHELLPNQAEGSEAYTLDNIIDHIKYLQLQIKQLSASKLQAESTEVPLVYHEGYGHYIVQPVLSEPLEEMMGKLLEEDPGSASQLLESRGLVLLPIDLVEDLNQAMQMFGGSGGP